MQYLRSSLGWLCTGLIVFLLLGVRCKALTLNPPRTNIAVAVNGTISFFIGGARSGRLY